MSAGLPYDPSLEVDGAFTLAGGTDAGRQLLVRPDRPTAIFAASDEMAIGVLRAARELHLRVPEDVSVVGVDDHELAAFFDLTTVAQPVLEQGRVAARQVLDALAASTTEAWLAPRTGDPADRPAAARQHRATAATLSGRSLQVLALHADAAPDGEALDPHHR